MSSSSADLQAADAAPSPKRRRVDQDELVQDEKVWMDDGNIIVAASEEKDGEKTTYAFRCHKSVLARQSSVFQDLFTVPQPEDAEQFQGTPVVRLPDACEDVRRLLEMLYDPR